MWQPTSESDPDEDWNDLRLYYPGHDYVDWIAADGHNDFGCGGQTRWAELSEVFGDFYAWGSARGKPLMIAEWGAYHRIGKATDKSAVYNGVVAQLAKRPPIAAPTITLYGADDGIGASPAEAVSG